MTVVRPLVGPGEQTLAADLAEIDGQVIQLFAMVTDGLAAATAAFLGGDRNVASALIANDPLIDRLQHSTELPSLATSQYQAPVRVCAIPTIGWLSVIAPVEPKNFASP